MDFNTDLHFYNDYYKKKLEQHLLLHKGYYLQLVLQSDIKISLIQFVIPKYKHYIVFYFSFSFYLCRFIDK
jgi:hypothetical protein